MGWIPEAYSAGLVSVIIPTFNRANLTLETLESVKAQTYRPLEVIIVDDGSTDNTCEVVENWSASQHSDLGLRLLYLPGANRGAPATRNRGLAASTGEFIQYLDSDDTLERYKLELHVKSLRRNPDWEMVYGSSFAMEDGTPADPVNFIGREAFLLEAVRSWTIPTHNPLFRRSGCIRLGPWDERMKCFEDATYMGTIFCLGLSYGYERAARSHIRGHHRNTESQSVRVSYRGETARYRDHVLSQYYHLDAMCRRMPDAFRVQPLVRRALAQECFRISRLLFGIGDFEKARALLEFHREFAVDRRSKVEVGSLRWLSFLLGKRVGARSHAAIHDQLHGWLTGARRLVAARGIHK